MCESTTCTVSFAVVGSLLLTLLGACVATPPTPSPTAVAYSPADASGRTYTQEEIAAIRAAAKKQPITAAVDRKPQPGDIVCRWERPSGSNIRQQRCYEVRTVEETREETEWIRDQVESQRTAPRPRPPTQTGR